MLTSGLTRMVEVWTRHRAGCLRCRDADYARDLCQEGFAVFALQHERPETLHILPSEPLLRSTRGVDGIG